MSFDYAEIAALGSELLAEFGGPVKLRKQVEGSYNTATSKATVTPSDKTLQGAFFSFPPNQSMVRGVTVQATDKRLLLEAVEGTIPEAGDVIIDGELVQYSIIKVDPIKPSTLAVLYDCHVRR